MKRLLFFLLAATMFVGFGCQKEAVPPVAEASKPAVVAYVADDNPDPVEQKVAFELEQILEQSAGKMSPGEAHNAMLEVFARAGVRTIEDITRPAAQALRDYHLRHGKTVAQVNSMGITPENLSRGVMEGMYLLGFIPDPVGSQIDRLEKGLYEERDKIIRIARAENPDFSSKLREIRTLKCYKALSAQKQSEFEDILRNSYAYWSRAIQSEPSVPSNPFPGLDLGEEVPTSFLGILGGLALVDGFTFLKSCLLDDNSVENALIEGACASAFAGLKKLLDI